MAYGEPDAARDAAGQHKRRGKTFFHLALVLFTLAFLLGGPPPEPWWAPRNLAVAGGIVGSVALLPAACWYYVRGRGYGGPWLWLAVLGPFGMIVIRCFPDRTRPSYAPGFDVLPARPAAPPAPRPLDS